MGPVGRAIWYLESHLERELTLAEVAEAVGASRFHLGRAFARVTGHTVIGYLRHRRLSDAARRLAAQAPDILQLALVSGYGSHEAFTRAFREQFGVTPAAVRRAHSLEGLDLLEALRMETTREGRLSAPILVDAPPRRLLGVAEVYDVPGHPGIPGQWQRFNAGESAASRAARVDGVAYGVCTDGDDGHFDYMCGVEVKPGFDAPAGMVIRVLPAATYAAFTHTGHVSTILGTWQAIFEEWFPTSGFELADAPSLEVYPPSFDPITGNGGLEIRIPVRKASA